LVSKERLQRPVESPFDTEKKIPDTLVAAGEVPHPVLKSAAASCNGDEFTRSITNMATRSWGTNQGHRPSHLASRMAPN